MAEWRWPGVPETSTFARVANPDVCHVFDLLAAVLEAALRSEHVAAALEAAEHARPHPLTAALGEAGVELARWGWTPPAGSAAAPPALGPVRAEQIVSANVEVLKVARCPVCAIALASHLPEDRKRCAERGARHG